MKTLKEILIKIALIISVISIIVMFVASPSAEAKLEMSDGEFYYSGVTTGSYQHVDSFLSWLLKCIGDIADFLIGLLTMGPRMVFVGWTALFEKLLTWALETTMGVNVNGEVVGSATDTSAIADSSNNITVESIVYNKVPALDANFFNMEVDTNRSGTGQELLCTRCHRTHDQCSNADDPCDCKCDQDGKGCANCRQVKELAANADFKPIIIQLKELVATWYFIMRLLATAAMLVVLVVVGIKMAFSTIASDKALYKRMLIDWVTGVIIMFTIHYFMVLVFYVNDALVEIIAKTQEEKTKVELMQMAQEKGNLEYSNGELETKIYEEIRTRAYDPKLTVGLSGMIMYMVLVYFAVRYTIIYAKRLLTVYVLALMAPAVGVSYALQKVLSGKASSLKSWMTEFIMNVIIQTVHALIYAIFIAEALVLSLESIGGMLVALILMNYGLKADKLFRKIFKMGEGDSLLGHTADAVGGLKSNFEDRKKMAMGLMTAGKPLAKAMTKAPHVQLAAAAAKGLETGLSAGANKIFSKVDDYMSSDKRKDYLTDQKMEESGAGMSAQQEGESDEKYLARRAKAEQEVLRENPELRRNGDSELFTKGEETLRARVDVAMDNINNAETDEERKEAQLEYEQALEDYNRYAEITTLGEYSDKALRHKDLANPGAKINPNLSGLSKLFGKKTYNPVSGQWEKTDGLFDQYSFKNRNNLSDDDVKILNNMAKTIGGGVAGFFAVGAGISAIAENPKLAMGLMAGGTVGLHKALGRKPNAQNYKGKYIYKGLDANSINRLSKNVVLSTEKATDAIMKENMYKRHLKTVDKLKTGTLVAATVGLATGGLGIIPAVALGAGGMVASNIQQTRLTRQKNGIKPTSNLGRMSEQLQLNHVKRAKELTKQFRMDSIALMGAESVSRLAEAKEKAEAEITTEEIKKQEETFGQKYDNKTGNVTRTDPDDELDEKIREMFDEIAVQDYAARGIKFDPKTGQMTAIPGADKKVKKDELVEDSTVTKVDLKNPKGLDAVDIKNINIEIDAVINEMAAAQKDGKIDVSNDAYMQEVITRLDDSLKSMGYIGTSGTATDLIKQESLEKTVTERAKASNIKMFAAEKALEQGLKEAGIKEDKVEEIKLQVEVAKQKAANNHKDGDQSPIVNPDEVLEALGMADSPLTQNRKNDIEFLEQQAVIRSYIKTVTEPSNKGAVVKNLGSKSKRADRKKRALTLDKILQMAVDNEEENETEVTREKDRQLVDGSPTEAKEKFEKRMTTVERIDSLTEQLEKYASEGTDAKVTIQDQETTVDRADIETTLKLLEGVKETIAINELYYDEVKLKNTSYEHKKKVMQLSAEKAYESQKKIDKIKLEEQRDKASTTTDINKDGSKEIKDKGVTDINSIVAELARVDSQIDASQQRQRVLKSQQSTEGVVDVNKMLKDLTSKKSEYTSINRRGW